VYHVPLPLTATKFGTHIILWYKQCFTLYTPAFASNGSLYAIGPLSVLSVTLVYCGQTVGWIKMPLGTEVGLAPGDIVLDGDPAHPTERGTTPPPLSGPCLLWANGRPSQQLLSSCFVVCRCPVLRFKSTRGGTGEGMELMRVGEGMDPVGYLSRSD